jgi:hypothetical protein
MVVRGALKLHMPDSSEQRCNRARRRESLSCLAGPKAAQRWRQWHTINIKVMSVAIYESVDNLGSISYSPSMSKPYHWGFGTHFTVLALSRR